jgi:hypothetical protein
MNSRTKQEEPQSGLLELFNVNLSYQAKAAGGDFLLEMLVTLANTDDSTEGYDALKNKTPLDIWPVWIFSNGEVLSWTPESHRLFLYYRDLLRRFWASDPETLDDQFQVALLFGAVSQLEWKSIRDGANTEGQRKPLHDALMLLPKDITFAEPIYPFGGFAVNWNASAIRYIPQRTFQRAVWLLFCQSWRAKVCPNCSKYFLAGKPAQLYCSSDCSGDAHRASSLSWWREKGSRKRARPTVKRRGKA